MNLQRAKTDSEESGNEFIRQRRTELWQVLHDAITEDDLERIIRAMLRREAEGGANVGAVLETIMAKAGGVERDTVAAGIGRVWAVDAAGKRVGGFAAEYEYVYRGREVDPETARAHAEAQLTKSLDHELSIRGLTQEGEKEFAVTSLYIQENYGIALAALGFLNYVYPKAVPTGK